MPFVFQKLENDIKERIDIEKQKNSLETGQDELPVEEQVIAALRKLIEREKLLLQDRATAPDTLEEVFLQAENALSQSSSVPDENLQEPQNQDLNVLSNELKVWNQKVKEKYEVWNNFKHEVGLAAAVLEEIRTALSIIENGSPVSFSKAIELQKTMEVSRWNYALTTVQSYSF